MVTFPPKYPDKVPVDTSTVDKTHVAILTATCRWVLQSLERGEVAEAKQYLRKMFQE